LLALLFSMYYDSAREEDMSTLTRSVTADIPHAVASTLKIPADEVMLTGDLIVPAAAMGMVVFAHGSGSSRLSPRNRMVARRLQHAGFATLLFDLLTESEEQVDEFTAALRFDIDLLTRRLLETTQWIRSNDAVKHLPIGYFGASTGAAAALKAASRIPGVVKAIVSRGGRPDMAGDALEHVAAPTLLIVGGEDDVVITLNESAAQHLHVEHALETIPGATHLFEEPGALEQVAELTARWFKKYL
jgi:dienelactone hydrolase